MAANESIDGVFLTESGQAVSGWVYQDGGWYYAGPNGFVKNQWVTDGVTRYLGADGRAVTGWYDVNGFHRYFDENGLLVTGWRQIENQMYYLDQNGQPITGWQTLEGTTYYFYADGHMAAGEWVDGKYLAASGVSDSRLAVSGRRLGPHRPERIHEEPVGDGRRDALSGCGRPRRDGLVRRERVPPVFS